MTSLPNDPIMLLSVINMKLRDFYMDIDEMCDDMNVSRAEIEEKLAKAGFIYDKSTNQFR